MARPGLGEGEPLVVPSARVVFPATDRAEIAAAISEVLATGALTLGPHTRDFEAAFAAAHTSAAPDDASSGTGRATVVHHGCSCGTQTWP